MELANFPLFSTALEMAGDPADLADLVEQSVCGRSPAEQY
jgi:hypothetical protein